MRTTYQIIPPTGDIENCEVEWPRDPGLATISEIVMPVLTRARMHCNFEHVAVLHDGKPCSMFVDDEGLIRHQLINLRATEVYHAASKSRGMNTRFAGRIHGIAILFDRNVWF